jgi:ribosomal protein L11 methyltransferase
LSTQSFQEERTVYVEAVFEVDEASAESTADALIEAGALSVSVEDADADSPDEQPLFGEPGTEPTTLAWKHSRLVALLDGGENASSTLAEFLEAVRESGIALGAPSLVRHVDEQDWVRATQAQFDPIPIGRLWVVPSWHVAPPEAELVLQLDPGMAFGTGTHPTTRLCLEWLERAEVEGASVLDYGCGSGILAIAAAKLGAAHVQGLDIDANAVTAARNNAAVNQVLADFFDADHHPDAHYDIVLANILSNPLKLLAPALIAHVAPGGSLVLSGVLERQADEVCAIYAVHGLPMHVAASREGWVCLASTHLADANKATNDDQLPQ